VHLVEQLRFDFPAGVDLGERYFGEQ
jgi:hypothetical protein